jgi:recombinational DNA repair protein (RecF pathway)
VKTIQAIVLRTYPTYRGHLILQCFSDHYGRSSFLSFPKSGALVTPFSLIEGSLSTFHEDLPPFKNLTLLDTFLPLREKKEALQSAIIIRKIIECALPPKEASISLWHLLSSLFPLLHTFKDWKTAPLLVALHFFPGEGLKLERLSKNPLLSRECHEIMTKLFEGDYRAWQEANMPEELFQASLELIDIDWKKEVAKGGT